MTTIDQCRLCFDECVLQVAFDLPVSVLLFEIGVLHGLLASQPLINLVACASITVCCILNLLFLGKQVSLGLPLSTLANTLCLSVQVKFTGYRGTYDV